MRKLNEAKKSSRKWKMIAWKRVKESRNVGSQSRGVWDQMESIEMLYLHSKHRCWWRCNTREPRALYVACTQTNLLNSFTHDWFHSFINRKTKNVRHRVRHTSVLMISSVVLHLSSVLGCFSTSPSPLGVWRSDRLCSLVFLFLQWFLKRALMCSE